MGHIPNGQTIVVDHKDNDKTNNFLKNLQLITHRENLSKDKKDCSSKYTGVDWKDNKWRSRIAIKGERICLGYFDSEIEASQAYQNKLISL